MDGWPKPLDVFRKDQRLFCRLKKLIGQYEVAGIVVGLPEGELVGEVKRFGRKLRQQLKQPVWFVSESLTSQEAIGKMIQAGKPRQFRAKMEDAVAAALILQTYLERENV
jgi:putative Holliday junction resolvase